MDKKRKEEIDQDVDPEANKRTSSGTALITLAPVCEFLAGNLHQSRVCVFENGALSSVVSIGVRDGGASEDTNASACIAFSSFLVPLPSRRERKSLEASPSANRDNPINATLVL